MCISVNATNDINPLWDNVESISIQLSFDGNKGKATAVTFNQPGVTFSEGILAVYEKQNEDWELVDATYDETVEEAFAISLDFIATSGMQYKAVFEVIAYRQDNAETITSTTTKYCP